MMKIYLSGRITGNRRYKEEFAEARRRCEEAGYIVLDPSVLPEGMDAADYARICLAMLDSADRVAMLPDWEMSQGATQERRYALYCGKPVGEYIGPLGGAERGEAGAERWVERLSELRL